MLKFAFRKHMSFAVGRNEGIFPVLLIALIYANHTFDIYYYARLERKTFP
jgi:hypothetical protein